MLTIEKFRVFRRVIAAIVIFLQLLQDAIALYLG